MNARHKATGSRLPAPSLLRTGAAGAMAAVITAGLVLVNLTSSAPPAAASAQLTPFEGCAEIGEWYRANAEVTVDRYGVRAARPPVAEERAIADLGAKSLAGAEPPVTAPEDSGNAVGTGDTGTNLQEATVDEPDSAKTNGRTLFTVQDDRLVTVDVSGSTPRKLSEVALPGLSTTEQEPQLLLDKDRLLVFASSTGSPDAPAVSRTGPATSGAVTETIHPPGTPVTFLIVVDVAEPAHPRPVSTQRLTGASVSARLHGHRVRLALTTQPRLPTPQGAEWSEGQNARANERAWKSLDGQAFLPQRISGSGRLTPLMACTDVYHPEQATGVNALSVVTLDLSRTDPVVHALAVTAGGDTMYASSERLYVAATASGRPDPVMPWWPTDHDTTAIHGFDITDQHSTHYLASGEVQGYLHNQWAMSARDGFLRVVATRPATSERPSESAVSILKEVKSRSEEPGTLEIVGEVAGLGKTEQTRAVRWFDDLAVVVTFRQTDPLYLVDVSQETNPVLRGELKIPGYSAYLHPIGHHRLLGVGQDATEQGELLGTQVSTFDVADLTAPRQLHTLTERATSSTVEDDSRVFAYLPGRGIAIIPVADPRGLGLRAVRVDDDGTLQHMGSYPQAGGLTEQPSDISVRRAIPVNADTVAAVVSDTRGLGAQVVLLRLDELMPSAGVHL